MGTVALGNLKEARAMPWLDRLPIREAIMVTALAGWFAVGLPATSRAQAFDPTAWTVETISWQFTEEAIRTTQDESGMAVLRETPVSRRVSVETDVCVGRVAGGDWKVAGVVIRQNHANFWHFALIEAPPGADRRRAVELAEMRDGRWLAQDNLQRTIDESAGPTWKIGEKYRMRITLDREGVEGELLDAEGRRMRRIRYAFSGPAVTAGRPTIRSNHCEAEFTAMRVTHSEPVPASLPEFPPFECASLLSEVRGEATGFFRTKREGEKWWIVDPLGRRFVPLGVDHVHYEGHWCEKLGFHPHEKKNDRKYDSRAQWADETLGRLKSWGFNLLGGGAAPELFHRGLAHTRFVGIGSNLARQGGDCEITPDEGRPCSAFPNVFHPNFERYCQGQAYRLCEANRGDPWLFGYFLDNELAWWGRGGLETGLFDAVMQKPAGHSAKQALVEFLRRRCQGDVARLNQSWGMQVESFDAVAARSDLLGTNEEAAAAGKQAFLALIAERYFSTIARAIRRVDPDHLILGSRFAGGHCSEVVWQAAAKYCDVLTFNYYGNVDLDRRIALDHRHDCNGEPLQAAFSEFYRMGGRPMMVTEWSFPAVDSGLPCTRGAGQRFRTQAERAEASEIFAGTMLRMPYIVGYCYFMWVDEPALGITSAFPENSNYGLIDEDGRPYAELTAALRRVHGEAGRLRTEGPVEPPPAVPVPPPSGRSGREVALAVAATASTAQADAATHPTLQWHRDGNEYRLDTGAFTLRGTVGGARLIDRIEHRGVPLGWYNALVQQWVGQDRWVESHRLTDARTEVGPRAATLDLIGRYDPPDAGDAAQAFEICQRLTVVPDADWFVVELLWCRNPGQRPLEARAFFFRPHGEIGGSPARDVPLRDGSVPRLWGRPVADGWFDEPAGTFFGLAAPRREQITISFWLNGQGGQHPDARWEHAVMIAPGETFVPPRPVWLLALAGRGNRLAWEDAARELIARANLEVTSSDQ